jgi:hypothetical protein
VRRPPRNSSADDGTTNQFTFKNERVSGGPGLAGTWKRVNTKFEGDFILVISEIAPGSMTLESEHDKSSQTGPTDGHTPWKFISQHPDADKHFGLTVLRAGPRSLTYSTSLDGKETGKGEMTVSEDGKTLADTQWDVTKPNEKTIDVRSSDLTALSSHRKACPAAQAFSRDHHQRQRTRRLVRGLNTCFCPKQKGLPKRTGLSIAEQLC